MRTYRQYLAFVFACFVCTAFFWRPLVDTLTLAFRNDEFTHIILILPISAVLIWSEWNVLRSTISWNVRYGLGLMAIVVLIALAAMVWPIGAQDVRLSLSMLLLVILWIGAFLLCFGSWTARSLLFPLCFLFWIIPIPSFALNQIIKFLQQGSALIARLLFTSAGVPVAQDGLRLSIPDLTVEVAKECSSIRSSTMLLVTTMVLAQLLLRSPWRKMLVIALAVPLSVAKNGLRIFTIAMLGTRVDPGFLTGKLHHDGGVVFFAIALGIIFFAIWILKRMESRTTRAAGPHPVASELLTIS